MKYQPHDILLISHEKGSLLVKLMSPSTSKDPKKYLCFTALGGHVPWDYSDSGILYLDESTIARDSDPTDPNWVEVFSVEKVSGPLTREKEDSQ